VSLKKSQVSTSVYRRSRIM